MKLFKQALRSKSWNYRQEEFINFNGSYAYYFFRFILKGDNSCDKIEFWDFNVSCN